MKFLRGCTFTFLCFFSCSLLYSQPEFWSEPGKRLPVDTGTPSVFTTLKDGTTAIFWSDSYNIWIATSTDGLTFEEKAYVAAVSTSVANPDALDDKQITSCAIVYQPTSTNYRMIYACQGSSVPYSLMSSTSTDMITWGKSSDWGPYYLGTDGNVFIDSPFILKTTTYWYLFYTRDKNTGNNPGDYVVKYATSTDDGITWHEYPGFSINEQSKDPNVMKLGTGEYVLYYVGDSEAGDDFGSIWRMTSENLVDFEKEDDPPNPILSHASSSDELAHPRLITLNDGYSYRMYYGYVTSGSSYTLTARATEPYLVSVFPTHAYNEVPVTITFYGEVFSPSPTLKLSLTGENDIIATSLVWTDKTTVSGVFDITYQRPATWDVTIINSNNESDLRSNGFRIDRTPTPSGFVDITDNVFNPKTATFASIYFIIYVSGHVKINIYTATGDLVRKLLDTGYVVTGDSTNDTVMWDGKNDNNEYVASGVYLMHIKAPGIDKTKKIVVIK